MILWWTFFSLTLLLLSLQSMAGASLDWRNIQTRTSPRDQADEVVGLLNRLIPDHAHLFTVNIQPGPPNSKDKVTLTSRHSGDDVYVDVTATNGVAAAWGIHNYLKYSCNVHVSWNVRQVGMPAKLPEVNQTLNAVDKFRYHQNVCVYSYTFAFWQWPDWERHIDWMALNGINIPLAFTGQEEIWRRTYSKLGLSEEEIEGHFAGPAFLAWGRMGNLNSWGGPLWEGWHSFTVDLQHKILDRMRGLGMTPILPAFAGHVPKGLIDKYKPQYTTLHWNGFGPTYLLEFTDPLFKQIGTSFIAEYVSEFGPTDHLYNCDTFNEMTPASSDPAYLTKAGQAVFGAMTAADPAAVWVMQGWIFLNHNYWQLPQVEALLTSVPQDKMIILDLYTTVTAQYVRTKSYFGQPFIFNELANFGGKSALFGHLDLVNKDPAKSRLPIDGVNSSMVGTGFTQEGLELTYATVDLLTEMTWRDGPVTDTQKWFADYATRRYGRQNQMAAQAWITLSSAVLNSTGGDTGNVLTKLPNVGMLSEIEDNVNDVNRTFDLIVNAVTQDPEMAKQETFRFDLVDISRQFLANLGDAVYKQAMSSFEGKDRSGFVEHSNLFLQILSDLDLVLSTDPHFMLGTWIESAKRLGADDNTTHLLEFNARNQLTLWGPNGEILDYASKHWSGLVADYYYPRWKLFFDALTTCLDDGTSFDKTKFDNEVMDTIGKPFCNDRKVYPVNPVANPVVVTKAIHQKYRNQASNDFSAFVMNIFGAIFSAFKSTEN